MNFNARPIPSAVFNILLLILKQLLRNVCLDIERHFLSASMNKLVYPLSERSLWPISLRLIKVCP